MKKKKEVRTLKDTPMAIRKSTRTRTLSAKAKEPEVKTNTTERKAKRRKIEQEEDPDKIDPVKKLLSLTSLDNDILNTEEPQLVNYVSNGSGSSTEQISLNFTKILNDNIRKYYSRCNMNPLELYSVNSSFATLNKKPLAETNRNETNNKQDEAPFFKNVNFGSTPRALTFEDYLSYDELTDSSESEEDKSPSTPVSSYTSLNNGKMSFHYRHNDNLNLSLDKAHNDESPDMLNILNTNSILSGKASEMVSTGNFLINDFFL